MRDLVLRVGKRFVADFQRDDVAGLAAELAYRFLFAIFPFGIFVAALSAFIAQAIGFDVPTSRIMGSLGDNPVATGRHRISSPMPSGRSWRRSSATRSPAS